MKEGSRKNRLRGWCAGRNPPKYAFMVYNILAKMTTFAKQGIIECGIEIVPMLSMANEMSTGVSYFEQIKSDLEYRGLRATIDGGEDFRKF